MNDLYTRFDSVFFEKTRLSLMTILAQEEVVAFRTLKERLDATDGALYTHLEKLVAAGYVGKERVIAAGGAQTLYTLTSEGTALFSDYIQFLAAQLHAHQGGER